jgi:glycosyltransferase involved in cell wall biosynthesis
VEAEQHYASSARAPMDVAEHRVACLSLPLRNPMTVSPRPATPRIAIVVPAFGHGGGVPAVAKFLRSVLLRSARYSCEIISLSTAWRDEHNVRLTAPTTWARGPQVVNKRTDGIDYREVGSVLSEIEVRRYEPRHVLTELLDSFDLVQLVAGTPAQAHVLRDVKVPVFLQVATLVKWERRAMLAKGSLRGLWDGVMTHAMARLDDTGARFARTVFVENVLMHAHLLRSLERDRVVFSPPGVDTQVFTPGDKRGEYLLSVGRFDDPRKNVRLLFDAYRRLRERMVDPPRLVLAGYSGPANADWSYARALGIGTFIDVLVGPTQRELADIYQRARVFVLASDEEGLGLAILEAMASALPVVSTRCGGPETSVVHGETGWLVERGDAEGVAHALQSLLNDELALRAFGNAARVRAVSHFSLEAAGRRFLEHYDAALLAAPTAREDVARLPTAPA